MLTCNMMRFLTITVVSVSLRCVCSHVVVFGLSVRLSLHGMWVVHMVQVLFLAKLTC